jgi:hypothetical protein
MPFVPDDEGDVLGYWIKTEREILLPRLSKLLSKTSTEEKVGLQFVVSVLEEIEQHKSDLIFSVEK